MHERFLRQKRLVRRVIFPVEVVDWIHAAHGTCSLNLSYSDVAVQMQNIVESFSEPSPSMWCLSQTLWSLVMESPPQTLFGRLESPLEVADSALQVESCFFSSQHHQTFPDGAVAQGRMYCPLMANGCP
jgi:hypothetical protein